MGTGDTIISFFRLGVEHILLGFDHLLFLAGLLVVVRTWRSIILIITTFTLAHSLTLALAALDVLRVPSQWSELLIAASIFWVGAENIWQRGEPKGRWGMTAIFGLVHGLGFATVLWEVGQVAVACVLVPLFRRISALYSSAIDRGFPLGTQSQNVF